MRGERESVIRLFLEGGKKRLKIAMFSLSLEIEGVDGRRRIIVEGVVVSVSLKVVGPTASTGEVVLHEQEFVDPAELFLGQGDLPTRQWVRRISQLVRRTNPPLAPFRMHPRARLF